jgi:PAS domain S-box-containing protein
VASGNLTLRLVLNLLLPFVLLRLIRHFRDIPLVATAGTLVAAAAGGAFRLSVPSQLTHSVGGAAYLYVAAAVAAGGILIGFECARSAGIKARRLGFLAAALILLGASFAVAGIIVLAIPRPLNRFWSEIDSLTFVAQGLSLVGFFFALSTPRTLLARWRRAEQATYLERTFGRDPEERGAHAADDLLFASVRSIGGAVTFVALRDRTTGDLVIRSATEPRLTGCAVTPADGLIGRVVQAGRPELGVPAACEPALAACLGTRGSHVLVAPLTTDTMSRGVVVAVLRRGALFPEDDLLTLAQLGRNAATALDHAELIAGRRDQERRAADRRVRQVEERMAAMLDSITDYAMLVLDADGSVAAWHHGGEHVFGYTRHEITGCSAGTLFGLSAEALQARLRQASAVEPLEWEARCWRRDGSTFVGLTTVRPLVGEPGTTPGYAVVTRDITERRQIEDHLRQSQKMEAIGQLAGGIAHDFNNLLTAILGYADWLGHGLRNDPRREQVSGIQKAAERAADLTRHLLAFSRRQVIKTATVSLTEVVSDLIPMLRRLMGPQIEIVDGSARSRSCVIGDRSQLEQVLLNLTLNARDAMPQGGQLVIRTADVEIGEGVHPAGLAPGRYVQLAVTDTGIGMDEATRLRVFEPFFTTKEVGRGTGLGLSTVYGIVEQMGGAVQVESAPGQGATFILSFPQAVGEATPTSVEVMRQLVHGSGTVLLVEDDADVRTYLTSLLESHGYRVIAAEHAQHALSVMESFTEPIHLVISDVVMPGSTGPELLELLGQTRPGLSALFISAAEANAPQFDRGLGDAVLLQKPFSSTDLLSKVRQILSAA